MLNKHINKLREEKSKTEQAETKINENKTKQNKHQITILLIKMSEHHLHPIEEQNPKQKLDLHLLKNPNQYHHPIQERKHLEVKIILNLHTSLKENEVGLEILKDHLLLEKITQTKKTQNQPQNQTPTMTPKRIE